MILIPVILFVGAVIIGKIIADRLLAWEAASSSLSSPHLGAEQ